jgi:hypothetical protein
MAARRAGGDPEPKRAVDVEPGVRLPHDLHDFGHLLHYLEWVGWAIGKRPSERRRQLLDGRAWEDGPFVQAVDEIGSDLGRTA